MHWKHSCEHNNSTPLFLLTDGLVDNRLSKKPCGYWLITSDFQCLLLLGMGELTAFNQYLLLETFLLFSMLSPDFFFLHTSIM